MTEDDVATSSTMSADIGHSHNVGQSIGGNARQQGHPIRRDDNQIIFRGVGTFSSSDATNGDLQRYYNIMNEKQRNTMPTCCVVSNIIRWQPRHRHVQLKRDFHLVTSRCGQHRRTKRKSQRTRRTRQRHLPHHQPLHLQVHLPQVKRPFHPMTWVHLHPCPPQLLRQLQLLRHRQLLRHQQLQHLHHNQKSLLPV